MKSMTRALYRMGQAMRGWNVLERISQLTQMESWSRDELIEWQRQRLCELLEYAWRNVPFYRDLWGRAGVSPAQVKRLEDLRDFPVTTKQMLVDAGDKALDQSRPKGSFVEGRSSGSTGKQFIYYKTREHQSWFIASGLHGWTWASWQLGEPWLRLQYRGRLSLRQRVEDWAFRCLYMPIDRLDEEFMGSFMKRAADFNPVMIRGYAGGVYVLARFLQSRGDSRLRPRSVVCTGDTLYPHYRQAIEECFGAPVFDNYGGEGMCVANECASGSRHVLPSVHVEYLPQSPQAPGDEHCRLLLTSLTNTAMPLIRYDIADIGVAGLDDCPCGRHWPILKQLVGRETDIVSTPAGRRLVCHHFNNLLREIDGVVQFQVIQDKPGGMVLRLETGSSYRRDADERIIRRGLADLAGPGMEVRVEYVPTISVPASGKRRYIISQVAAGQGSPL